MKLDKFGLKVDFFVGSLCGDILTNFDGIDKGLSFWNQTEAHRHHAVEYLQLINRNTEFIDAPLALTLAINLIDTSGVYTI
jgi:hypothetical protein